MDLRAVRYVTHEAFDKKESGSPTSWRAPVRLRSPGVVSVDSCPVVNRASPLRWFTQPDVPLTEKGEHEARAAGQALRREGYLFDVVFCSMLKRAIKTQHIIRNELDQVWLPERKDWRLNERHHGDLVGRTREDAYEAFGARKVAFWRKSYNVRPEPMKSDGLYNPEKDRRYRHLVNEHGMSAVPRTECMKDVYRRVVGYWEREIVPEIRSGKRVLVTGHANMLKTLLQHLDGIPEDIVVQMSIPRATPIVYHLGEDMKPLRPRNSSTWVSADFLGADGVPPLWAAARKEVNAF